MTTETKIPTLDVVRRVVGRRHKITRAEMLDILQALHREGLDLRNGHVYGTFDASGHASGLNREESRQHPQAAQAWVDLCEDITVISVMATGGTRHGSVRYDQPGSMHPLQHADLIFAATTRPETVGYLRRHADRVLVVRD